MDHLPSILSMFDKYMSLIENPSLLPQLTTSNVSTAFACARFVEKSIDRAKSSGKITELLSNLSAHWSAKNREQTYTTEKLENACDKLVEVFLKSPAVPSDVVDKLLALYVSDCGQARLNSFLELLLNESLLANTTLECMTDLNLEKWKIEEEARIFIWDNQAACGNHSEVLQCINRMVDDGFIRQVFESLLKLEEHSPARKLVVQCLSSRVNNYDEETCAEVSNARRKVLQVLTDDVEFRLNYIDAIFYFGRNMLFDGDAGCWRGEHRFSFGDVVRMIRGLMELGEDMCRVLRQRILAAREMVGGRIWEDVDDAVNE